MSTGYLTKSDGSSERKAINLRTQNTENDKRFFVIVQVPCLISVCLISPPEVAVFAAKKKTIKLKSTVIIASIVEKLFCLTLAHIPKTDIPPKIYESKANTSAVSS